MSCYPPAKRGLIRQWNKSAITKSCEDRERYCAPPFHTKFGAKHFIRVAIHGGVVQTLLRCLLPDLKKYKLDFWFTVLH